VIPRDVPNAPLVDDVCNRAWEGLT